MNFVAARQLLWLTVFGTLAVGQRAQSEPSAPDAPSVPVAASTDSSAFAHRHLQPYENVWRYTATLPNGTLKVQGLWTDRAELIEKDARGFMRRVQGMTYVNGLTSSQINVFDPATMVPASSEVHRIDGTWLRREFNGLTITETRGTSPIDTVGVQTTFGVPMQVFDFWGGMYGTLLAALPLSPGYAGTVAAIDEFDPKYKPASFRVVREEDLMAGKMGRVHAWVVESEGMTFWISANAPYILKLDMSMSGGVVAHWDEL